MEQERKISKPSMIGSILLLAGAVFLLNLLVPPSLPSRILSLLLTSALLLAFTLSDFRRLTQAESKVAYLGRRWLDLSVLGLAEEANVSSLGLPWSNYRVLEGLDRIATRRAQGLGDRIRLRTRVERIDWSEDGVRVVYDLERGDAHLGAARVEGPALVWELAASAESAALAAEVELEHRHLHVLECVQRGEEVVQLEDETHDVALRSRALGQFVVLPETVRTSMRRFRAYGALETIVREYVASTLVYYVTGRTPSERFRPRPAR